MFEFLHSELVNYVLEQNETRNKEAKVCFLINFLASLNSSFAGWRFI